MMARLLFSFRGRIGRGQYWTGQLLSVVIPAIAAAAVVGFFELLFPGSPDKSLYGGLGLLACLGLSLFIQFAVMAKRCHDLGKSGVWTVLAFVPLLNLVWMVAGLGIPEGQPEDNRWGPPAV